MTAGKRILIVDDHAAVRNAVKKMIDGNSGIEVCGEAENGRSAIEKAQALRPDAIVLDLSMPIMNGLEAARILRNLMPETPILMYTAFSNSHLAQEALAAGVTRVASKTSPPEALLRELLLLLGANKRQP
jgi:DNA-binding NarL/FixJ family response regulator